jgi:membrane-bound ClpP family serine protease
VTGLALLLAYPAKALTNPVFYLKLLLIVVGLLLILRETIRRIRGESAISGATKVLAVVSLVVWAACTSSD